MPKFQKKPVVISAEQWFPGKEVGGVEFPIPEDKASTLAKDRFNLHESGWCATLEGGHVVSPGDWIITGVKGERYPCKPDIFAQTYESVADEAVPQFNDVSAKRLYEDAEMKARTP